MRPGDLVEPSTPADLEDALALLVDVFHDDPFYVWFEPNEAKRPAVLGGLLSFALAGCAVHVVREEGRVSAVLAWHDPELPPTKMETRNTFAILGRAFRSPRKVLLGSRIWDQIKARRPTEPAHVVVELFAVDRASRGRGKGRALLDALLARVDEHGWIAHLETTRPENVPLYARFGFSEVGEPIVRGDSVPTFCLRRANVRRSA